MRLITLLSCLLVIATDVARADAGSSRADLFHALKTYEDNNDDLSMRITVKRLARPNMRYKEWLAIRRLLHRRPGIGYSMLFRWDRVPFKDIRKSDWRKNEERVNDWLAAADTQMMSHHFQTAFTMYQRAANTLKRDVAHHADNQLLFQTVLHSMARALYGAGRYDDALTVYGWISKNYPRYRQVLFEKMWAAFRGHHVDVALGAIASQRSAYFSDYMEPESYLVQIYIYKKLCRNEETKAIRQEILRFRDRLAHGEYTYADWARSDLENYSLLRLSQQDITDDGGPISHDDKVREQEFIKKLLMARFEIEKKRLMHDLNQVLAYSYISVATDKLKLQSGELDRRRLRKSGQEYWPVDDSEDWLDEIGNHLYIGSSQCPPNS